MTFNRQRSRSIRQDYSALKPSGTFVIDAHPSGDAARQFASSALGVELSGPVKLLTNPHCLGLGFNPLSVYFLHHHDETPGALIYEVSNTNPWNEIHRYVIPYSKVANGETFTFDKDFHVSPFNPVTQTLRHSRPVA